MAAAPAVVSRYDQPEMVATIKQTVAKGATDAQLRMFLEVCKSTGLNPFLREVWFVAQTATIMAGRDGYLRVANEHPQFDGMETRVVRDERGVPVKATCSVWRKDRGHAIICEAYYSEYMKTSPVWKQYPSAMISKVAEVLALKRSFTINGVVTEEEIGFDGRGSAAAAQEVAERKIAELQQRQGQPVAAIIEALPEYEYQDVPEHAAPVDEPSEIELDLRESIAQVEHLKLLKEGRKAHSPSLFAMLRAFGEIKARYVKIGMERTYYAFLGQYGKRHASEFPSDQEGMALAKRCYKEMSIDVANREVKGK